MFNAEQFCTDYNIPFKTSGKNTAHGWVQINCPFCTDYGFHGGINTIKNYFNCWHCGHNFLDQMLINILNITVFEAKNLIKQYSKINSVFEKAPNEKVQNEKLILPGGKLKNIHKQYLRRRNYDPDYLEKVYRLKGTGHVGNYKFRIIAPIFLDRQLISYQGRDVTNKSSLRYKACKKNMEILDHKKTLYGIDLVPEKSILVVEGITDVWRFGPGAVCTFGISFTIMQMHLLAFRFDRIFLLFDNEENAQAMAAKLAYYTSVLKNRHVEVLSGILGDPGGISDADAKYIIKEVL